MRVTVKDERTTGLTVGHQALVDRLPKHVDLSNALKAYEVKTFYLDDKPIGMLMTKGPELHVAILKEHRGRWLSSGLIRRVLGGIVGQFGYAVTSVMDDNQDGQRFVERLGFLKEGYAEPVIHYRVRHDQLLIS